MDNVTPKQDLAQSPATTFSDLDLTGRTLDDYQIVRRLGQGGMGHVYLAEQISLKRRVALKILPPSLASNKVALKRFEAEAEAVAKVTHANIVQVYTSGVAEGIPYIALEYVEGRNLREFLEKKGTPELAVALRIMRQVASAIQRAGELGVVHRDIKPDNILISRKAEVKVADFGLSRMVHGEKRDMNLTQTGETLGTPLYMSPEQVEGKKVDIRSDIYSFGVTCYHMLAGQPPFQGKTPFEVALQHVQVVPQPLRTFRPDLPELLCALIHKMLAKEPKDRYQTGAELLRDLARLRQTLSGEAIALKMEDFAVSNSSPSVKRTEATTTATPFVVGPPRSKGWLIACVALSILLAAGGGVALAWWQDSQQEVPQTVDPADKVALADVEEIEAIVFPAKREDALREAAEQYLKPKGRMRNTTAGFALCLDLGMYYLEDYRLEEAQELFTRLEKMGQVRAYHLLGRLGLGIVQSLQSTSLEEANEANKILWEVCASVSREMPGKRNPMREGRPELQMWSNPQLRYWMAEAMHYNEQNGVPLQAVHPFLRNRVPIRKGNN